MVARLDALSPRLVEVLYNVIGLILRISVAMDFKDNYPILGS